MHVRIQAADRGGCGFYRLRWPGAALADMGCPVELAEEHPEAHRRKQGAHDWVEAVDVDCDVLVLQRPLFRAMCEAIPVLQRQGVAVVVEIDDDFHSLPAGHPARVGTSARANPDANRGWLRRACERADLVTCSTPALAERYGTHGRVRVIPNYVPARYLSIVGERDGGPPVVGWTGSTETHVDDLRVCGTGVRDAVRAAGARFRVIGTGRGVAEQLGFDDDEIEATGWLELAEYPAAFAGLDVAIVPLQPNRFNEAKSWLKGLEAAALGVPAVCSPTGPYRALHDAKMCLTADNPRAWLAAVEMLCRFPEARSGMVDVVRERAPQFTIEANAYRWWEAWEEALSHRSRTMVA